MAENPRETAARKAFEAELGREFRARFPASRDHHDRFGKALLDHSSHAVRWTEPFMPVAAEAHGATFRDLDGNRFLDFWQGHFSNVFGHNPERLTTALAESLRDRSGLQTGLLHAAEAEVAQRVCAMTGQDTARFTTAGTLGTFYATVLARAFTGRERVLKIAGGWHGSQPFGLERRSPGTPPAVVRRRPGTNLDSEGLSQSASGEVVTTPFNDVEALRERFARDGDAIACMTVEPVMSAAGGIVATREFLQEARRLTEHHGALLVCDEIITAFRYRAGDLSAHFGVRPDLLVLGKILGGGLPIAAVAGRRDVMDLCTRAAARVKFEGGTFSALELSMTAAKVTLDYLDDNADSFYPKTFALGDASREAVTRVAQAAGVPLAIAGFAPGVLPGGPLVMIHPLARELDGPPRAPGELEAARHPIVTPGLLKAVLLLHGVSTRSGLGMWTEAHEEGDVAALERAYADALARFRDAGLI